MRTQALKHHIAAFLLAFLSIAEWASSCSNSHHHHNGTASGRHTRGGYAQDEVSTTLSLTEAVECVHPALTTTI
jgi:hypothetical protein